MAIDKGMKRKNQCSKYSGERTVLSCCFSDGKRKENCALADPCTLPIRQVLLITTL